jgi:hypothetical protein
LTGDFSLRVFFFSTSFGDGFFGGDFSLLVFFSPFGDGFFIGDFARFFDIPNCFATSFFL